MKKLFLVNLYFAYTISIPPCVIPRLLGRFGDNLNGLYMVIRFACKYNINFACPEFKYSNYLKLHDMVPKLTNNFIKKFKNKIYIRNASGLEKLEDDTLYEVDYYLHLEHDHNVALRAGEILKKLIVPKNKMKMPVKLNSDMVNVAVHVRKGGGRDKPLLSRKSYTYADVNWPTKFPPDSFYIKQIQHMFELIEKQRMHVHIFTDDKDPKLILEKYKKAINNELISFSCRIQNNFKSTTIEDFFAMSKFNYLIRPASSFSCNVQRLGNFKIVIYPTHYTWIEKDKLVVDGGVLKEIS